MSAAVQRVLEVALGGIDVTRGRRRVEYAQQREPKARGIETAKLDVATMFVGGLSMAPLPDALLAVSFAIIVSAITGVGNEADAEDRDAVECVHQAPRGRRTFLRCEKRVPPAPFGHERPPSGRTRMSVERLPDITERLVGAAHAPICHERS